jgi:hypothetical protein
MASTRVGNHSQYMEWLHTLPVAGVVDLIRALGKVHTAIVVRSKDPNPLYLYPPLLHDVPVSLGIDLTGHLGKGKVHTLP